MMTPDQERECIQRARTDPRAFAPLYDHYFARVHAYVCYRVWDAQDAEDVIADVFFKAIQNLQRFKWRHANSFAAWLFSIARNQVIDYGRRRKRIERVRGSESDLVGLADRAPPLQDVLSEQEAFRQMRALIATLSPRRQEVITLRFYAGLRNREIASVLGLSERTVAAHLCRALQDLEQKCAALIEAEMGMEAVT
jgi:RNA polymerase sigma-70 factor (ECF subfamily)